MEQIVYQINELKKLKNLVKGTKPQNIFIVKDKNSYVVSGAGVFINNLIEEVEKSTFFDDFDPNPKLKDLKKGIDLFKQGSFDLIIAIGGGSVLDMAKLISIFAHQNENYEDLIQGKAELKNVNTPVLAIPTTAGTGAEATKFAVLYIDKTKYSVENIAMLPKYVFLSSEFSNSASPYLTACTGLDAFCQAVESIWNINSTQESESYALKAVKLVWENLKDAVINNNKIAKGHMQVAAYLAGKSINITKTTAPHALSYAFTSYYGIPHGHAVALSLPFFLKYNYLVTDSECNDSKGSVAVKKRINKLLAELNLTIEEAPAAIINFYKSININIEINKLIKNFDPALIINNVNIQRLNNNPRKISKEVLSEFLNE